MWQRLLICILLYLPIVAYGQSSIVGVRIWPSPDATRVVFDLTKPVKYQLKHKELLITLTLANSKISKLPAFNLHNSRIKKLQYRRDKANLILTLQLEQKLASNIFLLAPNKSYGHRLVLDLENIAKKAALLKDPPKHIKTIGLPAHSKFVVAIDAGHGGEDPGAIGKGGTKEKDVALAIARYVKEYLEQDGRFMPVLLRNGDYYIGLYERVKRARNKSADLLVSIHADAVEDRKAIGASVFTLSEKGSSSAHARWLAARENNADLIGGVSLGGKSKLLRQVLLDLSQASSKKEGQQAAHYVLKSMQKAVPIHRNYIEQAGFAVLKAPDIPSMLIETGFITNRQMEAKLKSSHYQRQVAKAIADGIKDYFQHRKHS